MQQTRTPNLALIGCGAIARNFYLPALAALRSHFGKIWLVDPGQHALSQATGLLPARTASRLRDVTDEIQLVVVATPNHLHFQLAREALERNADVLLEKPFVIWPHEGRQILEIANRNHRVVAINQTRRFFPIAGLLRSKIKQGAFGPLKSVVHREGVKLLWPFESGAGFAPGATRTGVVMDFGVHVIDFYQYLLEPKWELISATHDGFSGPEGLAEIELLANGAPVSIRLSRYHQQENIAHLYFDRAEVSFDVYDATSCSVRWSSNRSERISAGSDAAFGGYQSLARLVLLNFVAASERREPAVCDPSSSLPVIDILHQIYETAGHFSAAVGAA